MKKSLIALALAGAFTSAAYAQSSVTLYGIIDTDLHRVTHVDAAGNSQLLIDEGAFQGNRFGFKGSEDLGGGTTAVFQLEGGFKVWNGQSNQQGQLFGRQAYVGLSNPMGGTLTVGRQYGPAWKIMGDFDPLGIGNWGQNSWVYPDLLGVRYDNTIEYVNSFNGSPFSLLLQYSPGGQAGSSSNGTTYAGGFEVNLAPVKFGAVFQQGKETNAQTGAAGVNSTGTALVTPTFSCPTTACKDSVYGVGFTGTFGPVTPYVSYIHSKKDAGFGKALSLSGGPLANTSLLANGDTVTRTDKALIVGANLTFGAFTLTPGFMQDKTSRSISYTERTIYVNGDFSLTNRTDVYVELDLNHINDATAGSQAGIGKGYTSSSDYGLGIRHRF